MSDIVFKLRAMPFVTVEQVSRFREAALSQVTKQSVELASARVDVEQMVKAFSHYHVNAGDGTDSCKQCGLNLRHPVHTRLAMQEKT